MSPEAAPPTKGSRPNLPNLHVDSSFSSFFAAGPMSEPMDDDTELGSSSAGPSRAPVTVPPTLSEHEAIFYKKAAQYTLGIRDDQLETELSEIPLEAIVDVINSLSKKGFLEIVRIGAIQSFRIVKYEEAGKMASMEVETKMVYNQIKAAGNEGIWTKVLKHKTSLHQQVITRCLKTLEQKQMIKSIKHVKYPTRKVYMLYELNPSVEVTGGAWYTDQELDTEFIENVTKACYKYIYSRSFPRNHLDAIYHSKHSHLPTATQIRRFILDSKISSIDLSLTDIIALLDVLAYDGKVEKVYDFDIMDGGSDGESAAGEDEWVYRAVRERRGRDEAEPWTETPCGKCPVFKFCTEDGPVSPTNCHYFQKWLAF